MDERLNADRFQAILDGNERLAPGEVSLARALEQVSDLRALRLPEPPAGTHQRLARRLDELAGTAPASRWRRLVAAWIGTGPFPRPLAQRMAAGALFIAAAGGGASAVTGVSPSEILGAAGDFAGSFLANLVPGGDAPAASTDPGESPTVPGLASATPGASSTPPVTTTTDASTTPVASSTPDPAGTSGVPIVASTPSAVATGNPATASGTPAAATPGASATSAAPPAQTSPTPVATPPSTQSPPTQPSPTPAGTLPPTQTPTTPPVATPTSTPSPTTPPVSTPSPTLAPPTPTVTATQTAVPDQVQTYSAGEAGSVTLRLSSGVLSLVSTSSAPGWVATIDNSSSTSIEIDFRNGDQRIRFSAEVQDGLIRTSVEVR